MRWGCCGLSGMTAGSRTINITPDRPAAHSHTHSRTYTHTHTHKYSGGAHTHTHRQTHPLALPCAFEDVETCPFGAFALWYASGVHCESAASAAGVTGTPKNAEQLAVLGHKRQRQPHLYGLRSELQPDMSDNHWKAGERRAVSCRKWISRCGLLTAERAAWPGDRERRGRPVIWVTPATGRVGSAQDGPSLVTGETGDRRQVTDHMYSLQITTSR